MANVTLRSSSAMPKRRGPGRKFPKGECEYRHKHGVLNVDEVQFQIAAKKAFIAGGAKDGNFLAVCNKVWALAIQGVPWAVQMVMDRVLGKVTEKHDVSGQVTMNMRFVYGADKGEE